MNEKALFQALRKWEKERPIAVNDIRANVWREIRTLQAQDISGVPILDTRPAFLRLGVACAAVMAVSFGLGLSCLHGIVQDYFSGYAFLELRYYLV